MSSQSPKNLVQTFRLKANLTKVGLGARAKVTPRIISMIEDDEDCNPLRHTMIKISDALGVPPSILFFPEQELEKRRMLSNMVILCMEALNVSEEEVYQRLMNMQFSTDSDSPSPPQHSGKMIASAE